MKNQENKIAANKRLAELLGWTSLVDVGGSLLGTPPAGAAEIRGQALVPDWAGDWAAAGPLIAEHSLDILHSWGHVGARPDDAAHQRRASVDENADNRDQATRMAIVQSVIAKLEAAQ